MMRALTIVALLSSLALALYLPRLAEDAASVAYSAGYLAGRGELFDALLASDPNAAHALCATDNECERAWDAGWQAAGWDSRD